MPSDEGSEGGEDKPSVDFHLALDEDAEVRKRGGCLSVFGGMRCTVRVCVCVGGGMGGLGIGWASER